MINAHFRCFKIWIFELLELYNNRTQNEKLTIENDIEGFNLYIPSFLFYYNFIH